MKNTLVNNNSLRNNVYKDDFYGVCVQTVDKMFFCDESVTILSVIVADMRQINNL